MEEPRKLDAIIEKVDRGERLTFEDGLKLMESTDLLILGKLSNKVRKKKVGNTAYYTNNLNINYTNICINKCPLCAFSRDLQDGYLFLLDEIENFVMRAVEKWQITEVHIVGGLHPEIPFSYYEEMLLRIKGMYNRLTIQAFTPVEIMHFTQIANMGIETILERLKRAGLNSLPGGGGEIFNPRVRSLIAPKKISGEEWLKVMEVAHNIGIPSNATMLYGHLERPEERIEHMLKLRDLQDHTNGFQAFVPLSFHPLNTQLTECKGSNGVDTLRVFAVSRLLLDNFPHIKGLWMYLGEKLTEVALSFGVDDIGGTGFKENIVRAAGATYCEEVNIASLKRMIKNAGRIPHEVNSLYESSVIQRVEE